MEFENLMTIQPKAQGATRFIDNRAKYFKCEKCGKRIIQRKENGVWYFAFGRQKDEDGNLTEICPVEIYIYGSMKIKCLRKECAHWNTLNFFPFNFFDAPVEENLEVSK